MRFWEVPYRQRRTDVIMVTMRDGDSVHFRVSHQAVEREAGRPSRFGWVPASSSSRCRRSQPSRRSPRCRRPGSDSRLSRNLAQVRTFETSLLRRQLRRSLNKSEAAHVPESVRGHRSEPAKPAWLVNYPAGRVSGGEEVRLVVWVGGAARARVCWHWANAWRRRLSVSRRG
jgi:hypothetical protein